jgi:hypothetical protein
MYPYPRTYPNEAVTLIAQAFTKDGEPVEKKEIIHAGWVVAGYTLGKIFGGGPEVIGAKKFKATKLPKSQERISKFFADLAKANRYDSFKKLEEENPSCWHHLNEFAKMVLVMAGEKQSWETNL